MRSNPLRAIVLEDEWPARNLLIQLIERSGLAHVAAAVPSTALAAEVLQNSPDAVDVAFVDVHLAGEPAPAAAGIMWIETFYRAPGAPRVVLTTASKEHALRAFELGVTDYLLKPFTADRVRESLLRVGSTLAPEGAVVPKPDETRRVVARNGKAIVFLERRDAWAFEAEGRLCYVHSARGRLDVDLSLTSLESVLGSGYVRAHRNWLVALEAVRSMERDSGELELLVGAGEDPLRVPVSRDRSAHVRDRLLATAVGLRRDGQ